MIFALVGEEALLLRRALDKLLSERVDAAAKDFNFDVFEGAEVESKKLADIVGLLPMMAPRRVVLIRNAQGLKKGELEDLTELLTKIPESTDLIFAAEKADMRTSFWQKVAKLGKLRDFKPLDAREAPQWLAEEARSAGFSIDFQSAQWLVSAVGNDLSALQSTLEKIYLLKGADKKISLADVESCVTAVSWKSIFDLTDAVGARNLERSVKLYRRMQSSGESPIALVGLLGRHFRILSKVKEGDSGGVPPFFLKDYQRQASVFDAVRLEDKREKIFHTDWALKSSPIDSDLLFERLLMDLCR
ncbi:MAG TPA: DNA polymerase III subunit delta [bacterium]|nr:DNA polymerase III subunit delta [bacterium]